MTKRLPELPEPPEVDPRHHEWFRTLELELSDDAARRVYELRLGLAVMRGLLLDLVATEDRTGLDAVAKAFVDLVRRGGA